MTNRILKDSLAMRVVNTMLDNDPFSKWLGVEVKHIDAGSCTLQLTIRHEMLNGFAIAHGGIAFSLADSALAFASNAHGIQCLSVETSISHVRQVKFGDTLTASVVERHMSSRFARYEVTVADQNDQLVALLNGTVYRTGSAWEV